MNRIKAMALAGALFVTPVAALAQAFPQNTTGLPYLVVSSCGTATYSTLTGKYAPPTMDVNGNVCSSATMSGGSTVADQSGTNATDGQATSTNNQHALAYEYIYNGATWDRARGTNGVRYVLPQDVRLAGQSLSAAANSTLIIPVNGAGTLGLSFSGLTASGATVTFSASNDGGATYTAVSSFNAATGVASPTYTTDGQTRIDVGGRTNIKLTVTTGGTGTVAVAATASPAASLAVNTSPLVAQTVTGRDIGAVEQFGAPWAVTWTGQTVGLTGALPAGTNTIGAVNINGTVPVSGTVTANQGGAPWSTTISGTLPAFAAIPTFRIDQTTPGTTNKVTLGTDNVSTTDTNAANTITSPGTAATKAQAVQGIAGATPVGAAEQGSALATTGITPVITQSGTSVVGKASQGNLYSAYAVNTTTTAGYLVCINAAAAPAAGTALTGANAPVDVTALPGTIGAAAQINYGAGPPNAYSTGITCLVSTSITTYTAGGNAFIQARTR